MSVNVEVTPSITQNPSSHHDDDNNNNNNNIAIDIVYNNYIEGVFDQTVSFTLPIEDGITWDNIFGNDECIETESESECRFEEYMEDYLEELELDSSARPMVIEVIATEYLKMKETRAHVDLGSSCLLALSVVVEIDNHFDDEVQAGLTMDLDDQDSDMEDVINNNNNNGMDVKEIRAFLETCGLSFSRASSTADSCAICLETMVETEVARLPCNHVFHGDCVVEMVHKGVSTNSCPLCRMELITVQS